MAIITLNYNCSSSLPSPLFSEKAQREEEGGGLLCHKLAKEDISPLLWHRLRALYFV